MGKIINPATGKPFHEVAPSQGIVELRTQIVRALRNRYDAAQTTTQNELHWRWADNLSPHSANSLDVRRKLRERSRYEVANNGYLKGIGLTITADFTGSGPTLQITDERFNENQRKVVEKRFQEYAKRICLRRTLWQKRYAKFQDGESFAFQILTRSRPRYAVRIGYKIIECDQVSTPFLELKPSNSKLHEIDGIRFDKNSGEPIEYYLLDVHPGESEIPFSYPESVNSGRWVPAENVLHWFRKDRPWLRGIPETSTTLPLWALLRRYTLAVVQNAEIAADFTVLLKSMQAAATSAFGTVDTTNPAEDWFSSFPIDRGLMTVLPNSYDLTQLDPKQPVNMYDTFVNALIQEAARPLLVPANLALGNSGGYNMASGTLDRQFYRQSINQERLDCNEIVLDPLLHTFWWEAIRQPEYFDNYHVSTSPVSAIVAEFPSLRYELPDHLWRWDEVPEHSDPVKVAQAIDILHKGKHLSDTDIQETRFNRSVDEHYANLTKQEKWRRANLPQETAESSASNQGNSSLSSDSEADEET